MHRRASSGKCVASFAWLSVRNATRSRSRFCSPASEAATASTTGGRADTSLRRSLDERRLVGERWCVAAEVVAVRAEDVQAPCVEEERDVVVRLRGRVGIGAYLDGRTAGLDGEVEVRADR